MLNKWRLIATSLVLAILMGCAGAGGKGAPAVEWSKSPTDVVLQIYTKGGFMPPLDYEAQFPELTVFGDGRVVFTQRAADGTGSVHEARLSQQQLGELLGAAAGTMEGLQRSYSGIPATDMATTHFYVNTAKGVHWVSVYGFSVEPWEQEQHREILNRLRSMRKAFLDAAASGTEPFLPDEVTLLVQALAPEDSRGRPKLWPENLPALPLPASGERWTPGKSVHKGAEARALAGEVGLLHTSQYRVGERSYLVAVRPTLPNIALENP